MKPIKYLILAFISFSYCPISFPQDSSNLYKKLYRLVLPRAKQGDVQLQFNLGKMYQQGLGVSKDLQKAAEWARFAANQGHFRAQFFLAERYGKGQGVPKNLVKAYKWLNLASSPGYKPAIHDRNRLAKKMTMLQLKKAEQFSKHWKSKK